MKFQVGDRVEWIAAPRYVGTVTGIILDRITVMWEDPDNNNEPASKATNPADRHRLIERDPNPDKYEIDCD